MSRQERWERKAGGGGVGKIAIAAIILAIAANSFAQVPGVVTIFNAGDTHTQTVTRYSANRTGALTSETRQNTYPGPITSWENISYERNIVIVNGGTVLGSVVGGGNGGTSADGFGNAKYNTIIVNGGSVQDLRGGWSDGGGNVIGNTVIVNGGHVAGEIIGGEAHGGVGVQNDATQNTVTITGGTFDSTVNIWGGRTAYSPIAQTGRFFSANTLNILKHQVSVNSVLHFENYNFALSSGFGAGDVMLSVSGDTPILGGTYDAVDMWLSDPVTSNTRNVKVQLTGMAGGSPLVVGDQITLINNVQIAAAAPTDSKPIAAPTSTVMSGVSTFYTFDKISVTDTGVVQNHVTGTLTTGALTANVLARDINPQTKALLESRIAGIGTVIQGGDIIASSAFSQRMLAQPHNNGYGTFAAMSGGSTRLNSGSHVDLWNSAIVTGISRRYNALTTAMFVDAGFGDYNSFNAFAPIDGGRINLNTVYGTGRTYYVGAGLYGRYGQQTGAYVDGSFRMGNVNTNYNSNTFGTVGTAQSVGFKTDTLYGGMHAGLGYVSNFRYGDLDSSVKYVWTHQGSNTVTLLDDVYRFDAVNSHRVRLGTQFTMCRHSSFSPYIGGAYEYEMDGVSKGTAAGLAIDSPSLMGSTFIGEVGLNMQPKVCPNMSLDTGFQGFGGKREGVAVQMTGVYRFSEGAREFRQGDAT